MNLAKSVGLTLALGGMLMLGSGARADIVSFITVGTFTGGTTPNTSTYTNANGVVISFSSALNNSVNVPPASQAAFGQFNTTATTATTLQPATSGFTLDIFQTGPTVGTTQFIGQLQGTLSIDNSQAFVQFAAPLTRNIGLVSYQILNADGGTPGRVNIAPKSTNNGITTINGLVNIVPEPSSMVLTSLLGSGLLVGLSYRRRRVHDMAA